MKVVKILERKEVIRLFGLALFLSPLFNNFMSWSLQPDSPHKWTLGFFWKVVINGAWPDHALAILGVIIGLVMLRGHASVWKFALALLGSHILNQLLHFGENLRISWAYGLFFVCNVVAFLFIADQLVWKQNIKPVEKTVPPPAPRRSKKILVQFAGWPPWAQVVGITARGFQVRGLQRPPSDIQNRIVEMQLKNGLSLRLRLVQQNREDYFFEYVSMTSEDIRLLNQWIQRLAA